MSPPDDAPAGTTVAEPTWQRPVLWVVVAIAALLVLASFTGNGTGMFGWGFMMGIMWIWMLIPLLLVALIVILVLQRAGGQAT